MAIKKKKVVIEVAITAARVVATEPKDLHVMWSRGAKSINTKPQTVD